MQVWTETSTRISVGSKPASLRRVTLQPDRGEVSDRANDNGCVHD